MSLLKFLPKSSMVDGFVQTQAEHQKRWERGSFLRSIQRYVKLVTSKDYPDNTMDIWLSLNTGNDSTAIWLEQKFGVPDSGNWHSANVFSMPTSQPPAGSKQLLSPVMIIFERTPAMDVDDAIERYVPST